MDVSQKIRWCQTKGLKLIEPNTNLSSLYIKYALETSQIKIIFDFYILNQKFLFL